MKINVIGNAVILTSALKTSEIETLKKYSPKALSVFEVGDDGTTKTEVFRVSTGSKGGVNDYGLTFDGTARDGSGLATLTIPFTGATDPDAVKKQIADQYGAAVAYVNRIEAAAPAALKAVKEAEKAVVDAITVG